MKAAKSDKTAIIFVIVSKMMNNIKTAQQQTIGYTAIW